MEMPMWNRITNKHIKMVGGVCAGFAHKFEVPSGIVRLVYLALMVLTGFFPAIIAYAILWALLPAEHISEEQFNQKTRPVKNDFQKKADVKYEDLYSDVDQKEQNVKVKSAEEKESNS